MFYIDQINEVTLRLMNYFMEHGDLINNAGISVSGVVTFMTLGIFSTGLEGPTKWQLSSFLGYNFSMSGLIKKENESFIGVPVLTNLGHTLSVTLVQQGLFYSIQPQERFMQMCLKLLDLDFIKVNTSDPNRRIKILNSWIRDYMDIPFGDVFKQPLGEELSFMILSLYLIRENWKTKFDPELTSLKMFKNYKGNQVRVKMMEITDYFKYCDDKVNRVHVIFIPLEYPSMYGVVVLPKGRVIIKSTIKYIDFKRMGNWFANSHQTKINLQLPKFKILNKIDFKSVLKHFDVSLLFTKNKANLGNMMMDQGYMNDYFQISSLDITEGGSYVDPIPPKKKRFSKTADVNFHVTRPFIFSIFENKLNLTIFMSAILDPSKKDEIE